MKKILILSANPKNTDPLRLEEEEREIKAALRRAKSRDQFEIVTEGALRVDDLRRALLDHEPQILHFSGHGAGDHGLVLENNLGKTQFVSTEALARLFKAFSSKIECVFLNACYSEIQAEAIRQHINYVVGMNQPIGDRAAIKFAVGFYDALGAGRSIEAAFEIGCTSIDLESIPESSTPVLKSRLLASIPNNQTTTLSKLQPDRNVPPSNQVSELEDPEGPVPLNSKFYVERSPLEADCYQRIVRPSALIRIKAPGYMGKTSLLSRVLDYAKQQGHQTASINFQSVDSEFWTSLDQFLQWFCSSVSEEIGLPDKLGDYWKGVLGSKNKSTKYFERYLLSDCNSPLVLGLDNVDEIFSHTEIATGFLGLLRTWHEQGKNEDLWKKLRFVIAHSKEVYIPLNINQSPFNVGFAAELRELNQAEVEDLVQRHGLCWSEEQVEQLMQLVGGHPYLLRVALYQFAHQRMTLIELSQVAPTEGGLYGEHLRRHYLNLKSDPKLIVGLREIMFAHQPVQVDPEVSFRLQSMGLVKYRGNAVTPLCDLYRHYFCERLKN